MVLNSQVITMCPLLLINHPTAANQTRKSNANSTLNENLTMKYNLCKKEATYTMFWKVLPYEKNCLEGKKIVESHRSENEVRLMLNKNRTLIFHRINLLEFLHFVTQETQVIKK